MARAVRDVLGSRSIILVGMMGAGKSSVGRLLARRLGRCFVETDDMITAHEGRSIPEIFAERGEAHFRALEEETVRLLALKSGDVIATGGGLPCRDGRPDLLRALGTVVWLRGEFDAVYERAQRAGARPMLAGRGRDEIEALYRNDPQRLVAYNFWLYPPEGERQDYRAGEVGGVVKPPDSRSWLQGRLRDCNISATD